MSALLVNLGGLILIGLIVWWFWLSRPATREASGSTPIEVSVRDGVYTPARIHTLAGAPVHLRFLREDANPCAEKVIFADLGISADLPVGETYDVTLTPNRKGTFEFTCQMGMYRGLLVVK